MSPRLARHLRDAVPVIVFFVIVALTWDNVRWYLAPEDGPREPLTVMFIGVLLALPLIVLESSALAERFRRLPFWAAVLLKTVTYVTALAAIFLGLAYTVFFPTRSPRGPERSVSAWRSVRLPRRRGGP